MHLPTKFDRNRIIHGRDIVIKLYSKWRPSAILNLGKLQYWLYLHVIRHLRSEFRINRLIWRRDIAKQHFQYGAHPPSCICYDVIILHQKTAFYVPKFVLNFHDIRLRIFWNTFVFHVSAFWLEIAYFGLNFWRFLVKKNRQNVKIKYYNPQKAHPLRKTRLLSVERWRFIRRCDLWASRRKQKQKGRKKDNKTVTNWLFAQTTHVVGSKSNFAWWVAYGVLLYISSVIQIG